MTLPEIIDALRGVAEGGFLMPTELELRCERGAEVLEALPVWHRASVEKPKPKQFVLVWDGVHATVACWGNLVGDPKGYNPYWHDGASQEIGNVTHWIELP